MGHDFPLRTLLIINFKELFNFLSFPPLTFNNDSFFSVYNWMSLIWAAFGIIQELTFFFLLSSQILAEGAGFYWFEGSLKFRKWLFVFHCSRSFTKLLLYWKIRNWLYTSPLENFLTTRKTCKMHGTNLKWEERAKTGIKDVSGFLSLFPSFITWDREWRGG